MDQLPKVELHLHMDISMSFNVARTLAPGLSEERYRTEFQGPARCDGLPSFLAANERQSDLLQDERSLALQTADLVQRLSNDGVVYAELRFAPLLHTMAGMKPESAVETVLSAAQEASQSAGIDTTIILCSLRHFDATDSTKTADLAVSFADAGVAFDLAGDEAGFALAPHLAAFDRAASASVPFTVHAGEGAGAESVAQVLDDLSPRRLGHGVRVVEDPELTQRVIDEQVHLEICPGCNVQLGLFPSLDQHPIDRLYRAGAALSVSTDNRTFTVTSMTDEYAALADTFGWTAEDQARVNLMAIDAAFARPEVKDRVRSKIAASYPSTER